MPIIPFSDLDRYAIPVDGEDKQVEERKLRKKLKKFGLGLLHINVLVYKFVYNWSFADIAEKLSIPHVSTAFHIYKKGLALLKERKFK